LEGGGGENERDSILRETTQNGETLNKVLYSKGEKRKKSFPQSMRR